MAYLCVDKDGTETIFRVKPYRSRLGYWFYSGYADRDRNAIELPTGSVFKLLGRRLTWEDEPVEY